MLMQPSGPIFQNIAGASARTDDELKYIFVESARGIDAIVARFEDEKKVEEILGKDFPLQVVEEQTRRIRESGNGGGVQLIEGRLVWPFMPFSEIASTLASLDSGHWIRHVDPDFGIYFIFVRSVSERQLDAFESSRITFEARVKDNDGQIARKRYRAATLNRAQLLIDNEVRDQILTACRAVLKTSDPLPGTENAVSAKIVFFSYWNGSATTEVSTDDYRHWLNDRLLRRIPRSLAEIDETLEDYVVEELSLKRMRAEGWDADPQFVEDKVGFAALQALDLYEREVLATQFSISMADVERHYREHWIEFQRPKSVRGRLLAFDRAQDAVVWMRGHRSGDAEVVEQSTLAVSDREFVMSAERSIEGLENVHRGIIEGADGSVFGPVHHKESYLVAIKLETMETDAIPLATVAEAIRLKLLRTRLDEHVRELAVKLAARYDVKDYIDYARYGLGISDLKRPWRR